MKLIFEYDSYREYLKEFFAEKLKENPKFSQRYFAKKVKFGSATYFSIILSGQRSISKKYIKPIIEAFELSKDEAEYFKYLVLYENAKDYNEKKNYFDKLQEIKKSKEVLYLDENHIKYYDKWYIPVIRHLAVHSDWGGDYKKLANYVYPAIKEEEARDAIYTLLKLKLLKNSNGVWEFTNAVINVNNLPTFIKAKAREKMIFDSINCLKELPADKRYTSCSLISISDDAYNKIEEILKNAKDEIIKVVSKDQNPTKTVQMNLQIFPYSKEYKNG